MSLVTIVGVAMLATGVGFVVTEAAASRNCDSVDWSANSSDFSEVDSPDKLQCIEENGLGKGYV